MNAGHTLPRTWHGLEKSHRVPLKNQEWFLQCPPFFAPRQYEKRLTEHGRARTITAFHVAQGNADQLTDAELRRDVLNKLMSPTVVRYWLKDRGWLRLSRKIGRIELLCLTDDGLRTCTDSVARGSEVATTPELVAHSRRMMIEGGSGYDPVDFEALPDES